VIGRGHEPLSCDPASGVADSDDGASRLPWNDAPVARVTGIGGCFFRARDPEALNRWYAEHLGVVLPTGSYDDPGWFPERGETVFTASSADSQAFGAPDKTWKINFRVSDPDGMIKQLRAAGIDVQPHDREYPNGRFAELEDPEANRIQLWEPNAASLARDQGRAEP
jgi:glyoxylase I family protein